ncbi:MAG: phytoene desaturase [Bacteroidia bacterium]|nr:phytoene desaturase [Bacteroidia bacterium]
MKKCAVIGSGIAGLAAAIRLSARGYSVDLFEANDYPGGKLRQHAVDGFRFDMGPSVFTMPHLIDELFTLCGKNPRDYFTYTRLQTSFRFFFDDGTCILAYADADKFAKEIAEKSQDDEQRFRRYLKDSAAKFDITNGVFIENSLHVIKNYFTKRVVYGLFKFHKIDAFKSMHRGNAQFFKDPKIVQLFDHYASYVGSNPLVAPATLNLIPHLVIDIGTYMPDKGMYSIVEAMVKLAKEVGVRFHFGKKVDEIMVTDHVATGLKVGHEAISFDRIISNMDVYFTYTRLLAREKQPKRILRQPKSSSILGFYWGVKGEHDQLGVHNMLFTSDEKKEYQAVFDQHTISDDPSVYICITSKHVKGDAPAGCENWFIIVTAPNDTGQNWDELVARTRANVLAKIRKRLGIDLDIQNEHVLTPPVIKEKYASAFGAVFGNSSNNKFAAFLRHPNFSNRIKGLYFVGGSVHPGAGIPMCLNSAKIMDKVFE